METAGKKMLMAALLTAALMAAQACAQDKTYTVTIDESINGKLKIEPAIPADGKLQEGTVLNVSASPQMGYSLDCIYYSIPAPYIHRHEFVMSPSRIAVDQDMHIGASFIKNKHASVPVDIIPDIEYAKPGVKVLNYDVYKPRGAENLPVIILIHAGGWQYGNKKMLRGMALELAKDGKYVVCSIDYRFLLKKDGDPVNNTIVDVIDDVFGAIAHIMEHAAAYGGDPTRIAVAGDSAGGHLAAVAADMCDKIGTGGFGKTRGVYEFLPTYIPKNTTVEQLRVEMMHAIQVAAPSYGVYTGDFLKHFFGNPVRDGSGLDPLAPVKNIPNVKVRAVPQYILSGTLDNLIPNEEGLSYAEALARAGQRVEYVEVEGARHGFFICECEEAWHYSPNTVFMQYAVRYSRKMEAFFDSVFYGRKP